MSSSSRTQQPVIYPAIARISTKHSFKRDAHRSTINRLKLFFFFFLSNASYGLTTIFILCRKKSIIVRTLTYLIVNHSLGLVIIFNNKKIPRIIVKIQMNVDDAKKRYAHKSSDC